MSDIERFDSNPIMSQAVTHNGTVYLAGQVAREAAGESVTRQTEAILASIDGLLVRAGSSRERILTASIWLSDMSTFQEMNAVWTAWVPDGQAPARATVEARLASPQFTVEIAVIAAQR